MDYARIILAAVICGAVITILIELRGRLLCPVKRRENAELFALIVVSGEAEGLEETARGLGWLKDTGKAIMPVVIVLDGATVGAQRRAERLARLTGGTVTDGDNLHTAIKELVWKEEETE